MFRTRKFQAINLIALLLFSLISNAQHRFSESVSNQSLARLKERTAVFVLPASEYAYANDYADFISKAWTLTPIAVVKFEDLEEFVSRPNEFAFFQLERIQFDTKYGHEAIYLFTLSVQYQEKKKKKVEDLGRIELYPNGETAQRGSPLNTISELFLYAEFRNFTLPYMVSYLRTMQRNIEEGKYPWVQVEYTDKKFRKMLATDTLFIPENIIYDAKTFALNQKQKEEGFFENYDGKYKIVTTAELIDMMRTRPVTKPLFIFEYIAGSNSKTISVLEANTGTIVFRRHVNFSTKLKARDISGIVD
jgi:hypothetical protein